MPDVKEEPYDADLKAIQGHIASTFSTLIPSRSPPIINRPFILFALILHCIMRLIQNC